jgi:hypothetical protein
MTRELSQSLTIQRRNHAAWLLLASRNGPLILSCLKSLIDTHPAGIRFDDAVERLATSFADFANDPEYALVDDCALVARRELRQWIKRGLIAERAGELLPTAALQRAIEFVESLEDRSMTSTASRLATVQRAIENLDSQLSPNKTNREEYLLAQIEGLTSELEAVRSGKFIVLDGQRAEEGIREIYQLATSLQADFRRVEDSYREADRQLRRRILSEKSNRGEIVDQLLGGHESLLETTEGQVFEAFHQQLVKTSELDRMKSQLTSILSNKNVEKALGSKQRFALRQLVPRLVQESERVIQARSRSERDVRGFIKSGIAAEQLRVGALLQDIFQAAAKVDWLSQKMRRSLGPLPPIAVALSNLPLIERFQVKQRDEGNQSDLDLRVAEANPAEMDAEFWSALNALDREQLFELTLSTLQTTRRPLSIEELADALPPTHDLETLVYWLTMARQAGVPIDEQQEVVDLRDDETGAGTRFRVPAVKLEYSSVADLDRGTLE